MSCGNGCGGCGACSVPKIDPALFPEGCCEDTTYTYEASDPVDGVITHTITDSNDVVIGEFTTCETCGAGTDVTVSDISTEFVDGQICTTITLTDGTVVGPDCVDLPPDADEDDFVVSQNVSGPTVDANGDYVFIIQTLMDSGALYTNTFVVPGAADCCVDQGVGAPTAPPADPTITNIYFDEATGDEYYWDTTTQSWVPAADDCCVYGEPGAPVDPPSDPTNAATYYDYTTGDEYYWDADAGAWVPVADCCHEVQTAEPTAPPGPGDPTLIWVDADGDGVAESEWMWDGTQWVSAPEACCVVSSNACDDTGAQVTVVLDLNAGTTSYFNLDGSPWTGDPAVLGPCAPAGAEDPCCKVSETLCDATGAPVIVVLDTSSGATSYFAADGSAWAGDPLTLVACA